MKVQRVTYIFIALCFFIALESGFAPTLSADEPELTITAVEAESYPTVHVTIECQHWPASATDMDFRVLENNNPPSLLEGTPQLIKPQPVQLFLLLDLPKIANTLYNDAYAKDVLLRIANSLRRSNDACRWSTSEHFFVFAPNPAGKMIETLIEAESDLAGVADQIERFQVQASKATQLHTLIEQILGPEMAENSASQFYVIIVSDGTFAAADPSNAQQVRLLADNKAQLFGIFLEDAPFKDEANLKKLVGDANFCRSTDEACLRLFWQRVTRPNRYQLTYRSASQPPFEIGVQPVITDTLYPVAATKVLWTGIAPLQVRIVHPQPGEVLEATQAITANPLITAVVEVSPPASQIRLIQGLTYSLDGAAPQPLSTTLPITLRSAMTFPIALGQLMTGMLANTGLHVLRIQVQAENEPLGSEAETFFRISNQAALIAKNTQDISTSQTVLKGWERFYQLWQQWWFWVLLLALLLALVLLVLPFINTWRVQRNDKEEFEDLQTQLNHLNQRMVMPVGNLEELAKVRAGLLLVQGVGLLSFIPIKEGETVSLGSSYHQLPKDDGVDFYYLLNNRYISHEQCEIRESNGDVRLFDGNGTKPSDNGTFVNGKRLAVSDKEGYLLQSGDIIQLGPMVRYSFRRRRGTELKPVEQLTTSATRVEEVVYDLHLPGEKDEDKIVELV